MIINKLGPGHIRDLTTPRYVEKIKENRNGKYKVIVDTHSMEGIGVISPKFSMDSDLSEDIDRLNIEYHNEVIEFLLGRGVVAYGNSLRQINRGSW